MSESPRAAAAGDETPLTIFRTSIHDPRVSTWWNSLELGPACPTFFQSHAWNAAWARHFVDGDARKELFVLAAEQGGDLVAVVPLFVQSRRIGNSVAWHYAQWIGDTLSPNPDLVTAHADRDTLWSAFLEYIVNNHPDLWLLLRDIPPGHPLLVGDCDPLSRYVESGDPCARLDLQAETGEDLISRFAPRFRTRVRSYLRDRAGYTWRFIEHGDTALLHTLRTLSLRRFGARSWFNESSAFPFLNELQENAPGRVWYSVLEHAGTIASILMGYRDHAVLRYVLSGLDPVHEHAEAGMRNLVQLVLHASSAGFSTFDFLRGREPYKNHFRPAWTASAAVSLVPPGAASRYQLARLMQRGRKFLADAITRS